MIQLPPTVHGSPLLLRTTGSAVCLQKQHAAGDSLHLMLMVHLPNGACTLTKAPSFQTDSSTTPVPIAAVIGLLRLKQGVVLVVASQARQVSLNVLLRSQSSLRKAS